MRHIPFKFTISLIMLVMFFCSKNDATYTIETKDGVKYVHNHAPLWGDEPKVALEFVKKIGELDTEDENYLFFKPCDIARDKYGNLYILDKGNYRIQKFNSNGEYITTFGRKGPGPAEFASTPTSIGIDAKGNIYVFELSPGSIQILTPEGKYRKKFQVAVAVERFRVSHYGKICIPIGPGALRRTVTKDAVIAMLDSTGSVLKEFCKPFTLSDEFMNLTVNYRGIEFDSDENMYVIFRYQNRIEKYSPQGKLLFKADRPLNFNLSYKKVSTKVEVAGEVYEIPKADFTNVSYGIGIDHKGRIWTMTYKKQNEQHDEINDYLEFEIFNSDGILLGRLPLPDLNFESWRMFQDHLYFLDIYEEMCVYEYKIIEK